MIKQSNKAPFSQRQLRVGELIKQSLGQIFLRDEAKVPVLETKNITVLIVSARSSIASTWRVIVGVTVFRIIHV